jgi:hypothetical protein
MQPEKSYKSHSVSIYKRQKLNQTNKQLKGPKTMNATGAIKIIKAHHHNSSKSNSTKASNV